MKNTKLFILSIIVIPILAVIIPICISLAIDADDYTVGIIITTSIVLSLIIECIVIYIDNTACPKCGKMLSIKEVSRKTISSYDTTMDITREVKDTKGNVLRTYKEAVPATHYTYECIDKCKFCGYQKVINRSNTIRK